VTRLRERDQRPIEEGLLIATMRRVVIGDRCAYALAVDVLGTLAPRVMV
jgi:hypothetical protein